MKLIWSPELATKAYLDTVKACGISQESGVAELVSAMAAGWNAKFIVETWSHGGPVATSIGLAVASRHSGGRHVCVVPDEDSRSEYMRALRQAAAAGGGNSIDVPAGDQVVVGEPEEVMRGLAGIDFLVVDSRRKDFARVLRAARLSGRGAVLVCKNAGSKQSASFRWRSVMDGGSTRRLVRSVYLPVGRGLDIAHVATSGAGNSTGGGGQGKGQSRWIKHVDRESGELHVIRK
ncbi:unnamed protein product [Linum trigynum]|uniref:S-adenosyl-L-methionine-dependent methyltransferase n=1 Tax=Linum trigynum TaxID=586398 RepID=A0AAV2DQ24_9ROSI